MTHTFVDNVPASCWTLASLCSAADLDCSSSVAVTGLAFNSARAQPGDLYLAMPGQKTHGARYATQAVAAGAVAVLTDAEGAADSANWGVPVVVADDPRRAMAALAVAFHHEPASRVPLFAVTGTNGKTTTTFLLEAGLAALGMSVGTIGTIGFRLAGEPVAATTSTVTTPEAPDLQALFAAMVDRGAQAIAMEVSSHALSLARVAGTQFAVAGFTMLGRDHLDFHPTMEDYFAVKASLFTADRWHGAGCDHAVVCIDDEWGQRLAALVTDRPLTTVGRGPEADVRLVSLTTLPSGAQQLILDLRGTELTAELALPGDYNAMNAALALAMIDAAGLDATVAATGLASASVPGRMQPIDLGQAALGDHDGQAPRVVVDFAHTPQAVAESLRAVSVAGRRIAVLGAGGDRDVEKRPLMGAAAAENAELVVVTDDNPRTEDPSRIRAAVAQGAREASARLSADQGQPRVEVIEVPDRKAAIAEALRLAGPQDAVLVLGKGHEQGQQLADRMVDFDDASVVVEVWRELTASREGAEPDESGPDESGES